MVIINLEELIFIIYWLVPAAFMLLFYVRTSRFNRYAVPFIGLCCVGVVVSLYISTLGHVFAQLIAFYITIFTVLFTHLIAYRGWDLPQAASVSSSVIIVGSYLWESPWLIRNAFLTGWEPDWILHVLVVFFLWFLYEAVGYKICFNSLLAIGISLSVSTTVMFATNIPPLTYDPLVWNTWIFFTIRALAALCTYYVINDKHRWMKQ